MNQFNLFGEKKDGKLQFNNIESLKRWINNMEEGEKIVAKFNISKYYKSERQLRMVYGCFRTIMEKTGYTLEEVKFMIKKDQGICALHEIQGETVFFCKSLSDFTKTEINDFILRMDMWSIKNLDLPLLNYEDKQFLKS